MKRSTYWIITGIFVILLNGLYAQTTEDAQKAYQNAYSFILNEQWEKAVTALDKVIEKHNKSQWIDDAEFWQCYAREKLGRNLEDVYQCYEHFIETYDDSKFVDDAKNNMVRIGELLVKQGKPQYKNTIEAMQKDEDEDVVLSALMALQHMGDDKGLPVILKLYEENRSFEFKEKILFLLSQFDAPEAENKLIEIAKTDADPDIREKAVFWLGNSSQSDKAFAALKSIMDTDSDESVREHVLFAFGQMGEKGIPILIDVAQNHENDKLREKAIFWLGQEGTTSKVFDVLKSIVETDPKQKVREQAIFALSQMPDGKGMPTVIEIAKTNSDPAMRKKAVFWISQNNDLQNAHEIIKSIIDKDPDMDVRENAVFSLSQLDDEKSIALLIDIAKNDPSKRIRKKAIFWLGQSDRDEARDALLNIIQGNTK